MDGWMIYLFIHFWIYFFKVLFLAENPVDISVNLTKYGFKLKGLIHTLIIRNVDFADAGKYTCR